MIVKYLHVVREATEITACLQSVGTFVSSTNHNQKMIMW